MSASYVPGPKLGIERGWQPAKPFLLSCRPGLGGSRDSAAPRGVVSLSHPGPQEAQSCL